jgi:tetratricopeptide (TPR) repeat protein
VALAGQARRALRAAGERAEALHSNVEAQRFFEQALGLTSDPREAAELHERAGHAASAGVRPEVADGHLKEAVAAYRSIGDRSGVARATAGQGRVLNDRYAVAQATSILEAGLLELGDLGDDPGNAALLAQLARAYMFVDDYGAGVPMVDRALEMAERLELVSVIADAMVTKGNFFEKRRLREAIALQRGAASLAQANGLVSIQLRALTNLVARLWGEDPREAWAVAMEALDLSRRHGDEDWLLSSIAWAGEFAIARGKWDEALALIDEHDRPELPADLRVGLESARLYVLAYRGEGEAAEAIFRELEPLRAELGRAEDLGIPYLDRAAIDFCRGEHVQAISAAFAAADAAPSIQLWSAWSAAGPAFAVRDIDAARRMVGMVNSSSDRGRYWLALRQCMRGGLAMLDGDVDGGLRDLREATRYMRLCDVRLDLVLGLLAIVELAPADHPARAEAATEARAIIDDLGARALGDLLDAALAERPGTASAAPTRAAATVPVSVTSPSPG